MTTADHIRKAAYADGYGDAALEVGSGAPPMTIWDSRFESLCESLPNADGSTLMTIYHRRYYDGWVDGEYDTFQKERSDD